MTRTDTTAAPINGLQLDVLYALGRLGTTSKGEVYKWLDQPFFFKRTVTSLITIGLIQEQGTNEEGDPMLSLVNHA